MERQPTAELRAKLEQHLERIYPPTEVPRLVAELERRIETQRPPAESGSQAPKWSERDVMLITYGDSLIRGGEAPLRTLLGFLREQLADTVSGVHILPFYPFSSDDGFSVIDYVAVRDSLGTWDDVRALTGEFDLMADLVINHVSAESEWFQQFLRGEAPGKDYFHALDPDVAAATDVSEVVRPRPHHVLVPFEMSEGTRHVWATFSEDQIDLDFSNPDVLLEMVDVLLFYLAQGARWIRLDAVGFLWKEVGTRCIHLPQTHEVVRLLRTITEAVEPRVVLITETNVPNAENLSYFGDDSSGEGCDEAHGIYNFSLPPLLVDALIQGRSTHLSTWMKRQKPAPFGCTYFNFTASHDGIGLRPAEGLLGAEDLQALIETMQRFGGRISTRALADGRVAPYEINITFFDALRGTVRGEDEHQEARFLCSQAVQLGVEGVPAFYVHSLLATPNDNDGVLATGRNRSINRKRLDHDDLAERLADPETIQSRILSALRQLIRTRRRQPAFHPNATQYTLSLGEELFGFWRQSPKRDQSIFAVHNVTDQPQELTLSSLNLLADEPWIDLIGGASADELTGTLALAPYQSVWLTNRPC